MADSMTCPACTQEHVVGTKWCPVMYTDITSIREAPEPTSDVSPSGRSASVRTHADPPATCPNCGASGRSGSPCVQCLDVIPSESRSTARSAFAVLPSYRAVSLPRGREVVLGRQSSIPEISSELEMFDGVSRHHCIVVIDAEYDSITIRDLGSLNRTWVDDDDREIGDGEDRRADLPVRIRLGQTAYVSITTEGEQ